MQLSDDLRRAIDAWRADDPDPNTREELARLLAAADHTELADRFAMELEFGTAGLRGLIGAGPNRMNRKVVLRTTAGLCSYVLAHVKDAAQRGLCIGFDGRRMSRELAQDAAAVARGMGLNVHMFRDVVPTPLLAFACVELRAAAAVMVTASHNPPAYNGYKVYWENGAQIIPPHDEGIAAAIAKVGTTDTIARGDAEDVQWVAPEVERRYLDRVREEAVHPELPRSISIAYTALHGVGARLAKIALAEAGFTRVHSVREQEEPDGEFPTVEFPNPEEKGAMDLVLALAREQNADLVLANDPDADRLAVAVRDRHGAYTQLTGNDVGCLLGHYLLSEEREQANRVVINTIVSSPMLGAIAKAHGAAWETTLTGFKWIANRAMEHERTGGPRFVFGYEEALGYTVGPLVRDKDGIGTAVVIADLAAWCASRGKTLLDELETAWRRYGMYLSRQVSKTMPGADGAATIRAIMDAVRSAPPSALGAHRVEAYADLKAGERRSERGVEKLHLPASNVISLELAGGHRVMLRPSGTEPKIKFYFDVCVTMGDGESVDDARRRGDALLDRLVQALEATIA